YGASCWLSERGGPGGGVQVGARSNSDAALPGDLAVSGGAQKGGGRGGGGCGSERDPTALRHFQVIWLLARGHTIADVAAVTSFVPRWIEQLLARYNAHGPEALGDLRRRNGGVPRVLRPALLERLRARLEAPPPDGGLWSSRKVAAWMAGELGRAAVLPQRGWGALEG